MTVIKPTRMKVGVYKHCYPKLCACNLHINYIRQIVLTCCLWKTNLFTTNPAFKLCFAFPLCQKRFTVQPLGCLTFIGVKASGDFNILKNISVCLRLSVRLSVCLCNYPVYSTYLLLFTSPSVSRQFFLGRYLTSFSCFLSTH